MLIRLSQERLPGAGEVIAAVEGIIDETVTAIPVGIVTGLAARAGLDVGELQALEERARLAVPPTLPQGAAEDRVALAEALADLRFDLGRGLAFSDMLWDAGASTVAGDR